MRIINLIIILLKYSIAQRNYEFQNGISNQQNYQSSFYQSSPKYQTESISHLNRNVDSRNYKNSYFSSRDDHTDYKTDRVIEFVTQSPQFGSDRTSENIYSSHWSTNRFHTESSTIIPDLKMNSKNSRSSLSSNQQANYRKNSFIVDSKEDNLWSTTTQSNYFQGTKSSRIIETTTNDNEKYYTNREKNTIKTSSSGLQVNSIYSDSYDNTFLKNQQSNRKHSFLPDSNEDKLWSTTQSNYIQSTKSSRIIETTTNDHEKYYYTNEESNSKRSPVGLQANSIYSDSYNNPNTYTTPQSNFHKIGKTTTTTTRPSTQKSDRFYSSNQQKNSLSFSTISETTNDTTKLSSKLKTENKRICLRKYEEFVKKIFGDNDFSELENELVFRTGQFDGREVVEPGEYPHMAAVGYRQTDGSMDWKCGGSLIDEYFVLTAAHCTDFSGQKPIQVRIGDINLKVNEKTVEPQTIVINKIYNHPNYNISSYYNDIALLKLENRVTFTKFVRPIRLYVKNNIPYDTVYAMGYGATAFGKAKTNILTDLDLKLVQNDDCDNLLPKEVETSKGIIQSQICAVDKKGNRDTCQGDSGGPLQLNLLGSKRIQYHLIGITSYGLFCGTQKPSVYTRVSTFIDWIEKTVWPND